jgi:hypothetical protein
VAEQQSRVARMADMRHPQEIVGVWDWRSKVQPCVGAASCSCRSSCSFLAQRQLPRSYARRCPPVLRLVAVLPQLRSSKPLVCLVQLRRLAG